jgi:hypothetical protein
MTDEQFVKSIYPSANIVRGFKKCAILVEEELHSYYISEFFYFDDYAWKGAARKIQKDMLRKLQS